MIRSGSFVSDYVDGAGEDAVQPNGVDLSIGRIYEHEGRAVLSDDGYKKPERREVPTTERDDGDYFVLNPGVYVVEYGEVVEIPENHAGLVFPRSRLMRSGGTVVSAVWDSGYRGRGEGGLWVDVPTELEAGMGICQMVFVATEELEYVYEGSHQHENL